MLAYDLHIHSALSPCGDDDMTPNNIINMAIIKQLDVIAVTDHNSAGNLRSIMEVAKDTDIIVVPGIEVETAEEIHVLCYFPTVEQAEKMGEYLRSKLPSIENRVDIFGRQIYLNCNDEEIGEENQLLSTAVTASFQTIINKCKELGGVPVPAHIDKKAYSVLSSLGFIPEECELTTVEITPRNEPSAFLSANNLNSSYKVIQNSDAHYLWDISERQRFVHVKQNSVEGILEFLCEK